MATANLIANIVVRPLFKPTSIYPKTEEDSSKVLNLITILLFISGVCFLTLCLNRPIFAFDGTTSEQIIQTKVENHIKAVEVSQWEESILKKYEGKKVYFKADGVAHIRTTKYLNGYPTNINIVEINPNINKNLIIKPEIAGEKLNSKAQIKNIAKKNNALVAINGGYFKPQTGVPLGSLVINGETLTGPIYNRVGIGIEQNENGTKFSMAHVSPTIKIKNSIKEIEIDNINQPRMLSTYSIVYNSLWGEYSPHAPKYGINALIQDGKIVDMSENPIKIPENGYVLSAPYEKINTIFGLKNLEFEILYPEEFKNANHILGAGPYLVKNGKVYVDAKDEKLTSIAGRNPRSAIGYTKDNNLIIITADGREQSSVGLTLTQLANFMKSLDCYNAMNFDGGSSTVMYIGGRVANSPNAGSNGIKISNALIIKEEI